MHAAFVLYTNAFDVCVLACLEDEVKIAKASLFVFLFCFFQAWFMVEMKLKMKCDAGA